MSEQEAGILQAEGEAEANAGGDVVASRDAKGHFLPGQSGNPAGKKPGTRSRRSALLAELCGDGGAAIIARLVAEAEQGKPYAVKLALERLVSPLRRERFVAFDLPQVQNAQGVAQALASVIAACAAGEITIEEAKSFALLLETQRRAVESHDLAVRIETLEQEARNAGKRRYGL